MKITITHQDKSYFFKKVKCLSIKKDIDGRKKEKKNFLEFEINQNTSFKSYFDENAVNFLHYKNYEGCYFKSFKDFYTRLIDIMQKIEL